MAAKKPTRKQLIDKADRLFSLKIRSSGSCQACGAVDRLQCAHGFSRRYWHARWDERNAFCLCAPCHWKYTNDPLKWDIFLEEAWGPLLYRELRDLALQTGKIDLAIVVENLLATSEPKDPATTPEARAD